MEKIVEFIVAFLARKVIAKYRPKIIGITGSVGKTSARQAIFCVVNSQFRSYTPVKNFNSTLGLPLGVLMSDSPERNIVGWLKVFFHGLNLLVFARRYPEVLVLEYGIDHSGEMERLLAIARPDIAVLTYIGNSHLENFNSQEQLAEEKTKLLLNVTTGGTIIWNADNPLVVDQSRKVVQARSDIRTIDYSLFKNPDAQVRTDDLSESFVGGTAVTDIVTKTPTRVPNFRLNCIGEAHVHASLASVAVAEVLEISSESIRQALSNYKPQPGRLNVLNGLRKSIILDDTYNSSPASSLTALETLSKLRNLVLMANANLASKGDVTTIAVLGDMLELGSEEAEEHQKIGKKVADLKISQLVAVGRLAKFIAEGAVNAGMQSDRVTVVENSTEASKFFANELNENLIVLVKGSQGVRMERVVKEILAEPMRAKELLCRQSEKWLKR